MKREYHRWHSPSLDREMELLVFGHAGAPVLAFPTSLGRFYEWEDFGMVGVLADHLEQGRIQLYCVDSVDAESWYNNNLWPRHDRAWRHLQYERYLLDEALPFIRGQNADGYLVVSGCSFGAYHAANLAFKYPWLFRRLLAISGQYDLDFILHGDFDQNCFFNSPMSYLPGLNDERYLTPLRTSLEIVLCAGGWSDMCHQGTQALAAVLRERGIPHTLDIWDAAWHDWPWWRQMAAKYL